MLDGVDIRISAGEFVAIVGPSGAGKSTLLYLLGLLDRPTSGRIVVCGRETTGFSDAENTAFRRNKMGYVFQDYALLPDLTALENAMVPLLSQGWTVRDAETRARTALSEVGLGKETEKLPNQLSGGQQQRVGVARAIAHKPEILFADEPTANLDSRTSSEIIDLLLNLRENGQTIVLVTHEADHAARADRVVELRDGKIVQDVRT